MKRRPKGEMLPANPQLIPRPLSAGWRDVQRLVLDLHHAINALYIQEQEEIARQLGAARQEGPTSEQIVAAHRLATKQYEQWKKRWFRNHGRKPSAKKGISR